LLPEVREALAVALDSTFAATQAEPEVAKLRP
jgi:hypothetical protein